MLAIPGCIVGASIAADPVIGITTGFNAVAVFAKSNVISGETARARFAAKPAITRSLESQAAFGILPRPRTPLWPKPARVVALPRISATARKFEMKVQLRVCVRDAVSVLIRFTRLKRF
jgi:hypothetical protein